MTENIHPQAASFISEYHKLADDFDLVTKELKLKNDFIDKQTNYINDLNQSHSIEIDDINKLLQEVSAKADHYMKLCIEMRTIYKSINIQIDMADKAFINAPFANSPGMIKLQQIEDGKPSPSFLHEELQKIANDDGGWTTKTDKITNGANKND